MSTIKTLRLKEILFYSLDLLFAALLLLKPSPCISAAKDGLNISLYLVLPSLFPFAVISSYIAGNLTLPDWTCRLFSGFSGIGKGGTAPFLLGLISGYPVGAMLTADAVKDKRISAEEGAHILPFCNACGPLFMVGVVGGGMLGSFETGYFLYGVHLLSICTVLLCTRTFAPLKKTNRTDITRKISFVQILDRSTHSMLNVCACITFFSVVCQMLKISGIFENLFPLSSIPYGMVELTNGLNKLALSELPMRLKLSVASFLCGFSGICILLQVQNAVKNTGIALLKYTTYKLCIGVVAFLLTWLLFPLFPYTIPTFSAALPLSPAYVAGSYGFLILLLPLYRFLRRFGVAFFDKR